VFDILYKYAHGEKIPPMIINPDRFFDASNAKEVLPTAF
jgi:ribose transport system substrate-binding protein